MSERRTATAAASGLGIGGILAIVLSWTANKSILWAILHALCGWFYVIYWAITN